MFEVISKNFPEDLDIGPEEITELLAPGIIERLMEDSRTPIMIGKIGTRGDDDEFEMQPYYQIPPVGFDPEKDDAFMAPGGCFAFKRKGLFGRTRIGATFTLSDEQAREVEERVRVIEISESGLWR